MKIEKVHANLQSKYTLISNSNNYNNQPSFNLLCKLSDYIALLYLVIILMIQILATLNNTYFTPFSLVEECAYTFTSALNYLDFGFFNSGFLQDFANSKVSDDHPYVYNHMPPGPDIFTSILLWLSNRNFVFVRIVYTLITIIGLYYYLIFGNLILKNINLKLGSFALIFIGAWVIIQTMERQIYSPFPFLAFFPIVSLYKYYITRRSLTLIYSILVAFLSSIYLEYSLLSGVMFCWIFLYLTQLIQFQLKHVLLILSAILFGIGTHLLQNLIYLGPSLFIRELFMTLSNRITGSPSQTEMRNFFEQIGLVHHGARAAESSVLFAQIKSNFLFPGISYLLLIFFLTFIFILVSKRYLHDTTLSKKVHDQFYEAKYYLLFNLRIIIWLVGTISAPIVLFPAFAQEVNLRGMGANFYLIGVGVAGVIGFAVREIINFCIIECNKISIFSIFTYARKGPDSNEN